MNTRIHHNRVHRRRARNARRQRAPTWNSRSDMPPMRADDIETMHRSHAPNMHVVRVRAHADERAKMCASATLHASHEASSENRDQPPRITTTVTTTTMITTTMMTTTMMTTMMTTTMMTTTMITMSKRQLFKFYYDLDRSIFEGFCSKHLWGRYRHRDYVRYPV